ncbi:hypothetical protein [Siphonobacter sp. SORGH_AS_1065]|uniref:hypothetical protein n=1 Tax=Siphonobacter sp. SORGH_AS_1065 TaxID=3041795 RepID=UPI0027811216|nr:hypothetical protein [Siphonobacter sp. SORGH_AS_1065]MDQ1089003.1 hypothetical protein [Siphonobacter sp. SORGH_AS_1065]
MASSLDLTSFAASLTDFARDNRAHIFTRLLIPGMEGIAGTPIHAIKDYMTLIPGNDEVVLTNLITKSVLQPGRKGKFTPTADAVKFQNRVAKVRPCKVDLEFDEPKIEMMYKSYLGEVAGGDIDPTTFPFEAYVIAEVIAQAQQDMRLISLYNGVYNAAGNGPLDVFDGILTQLLEAITESQVPASNIVELQAFSSTNAVAQFEKIVAAIPDRYFYSDLICILPRTIKTFYENDYRKQFTALPYNVSTDKGFIDGTNIPFVVEPGFNHDVPLITPRKNLCYLYDDESKQNKLDFDYDKRERNLAYIMDFQAACGIAATELIWTGDVN